VPAYSETAQDVSAPEGREVRARNRRGNRGALPARLPRIEVVIDIDNKICPCCQGELHRIGEDRSERLDLVPPQFRKNACRGCEDGVTQALAPARLIEGWIANQGHRRPRPGLEICRSPAALSAGGRYGRSGDATRSAPARDVASPDRLSIVVSWTGLWGSAFPPVFLVNGS